LEVVVTLQRNFEIEQQFLLPVTLQTFFDRFPAGSNPRRQTFFGQVVGREITVQTGPQRSSAQPNVATS
jgi:hypothetical protein